MGGNETKKRILNLVGEGVPIPRIAKLLKISKTSVWKHIKRLEQAGTIIRIAKKPAMFKHVSITPNSMHSTNISTPNHRNLIHSAHKLKFSISYSGAQPTKEATEVKPFGRYGTAKQVIYKYKNITIVAFKKKLNVWIHNPKGKLTTNQIINARRDAYLSVLAFSKEHRLTLGVDLSSVLRSHHVVEHEALNESLKPILEAYPKEIEERIGSKICQTSHKGKIEHEGASKELTGAVVSKNLEYLVTQFPSDFATLAQANGEFRENLLTHLEVMREISRTMKDIRDGLKRT